MTLAVSCTVDRTRTHVRPFLALELKNIIISDELVKVKETMKITHQEALKSNKMGDAMSVSVCCKIV